jgi:hypothetical protein
MEVPYKFQKFRDYIESHSENLRGFKSAFVRSAGIDYVTFRRAMLLKVHHKGSISYSTKVKICEAAGKTFEDFDFDKA